MSNPVEPRKPLSARLKAGEPIDSILSKENAETMKRLLKDAERSKSQAHPIPVSAPGRLDTAWRDASHEDRLRHAVTVAEWLKAGVSK